MQVRVLGPLQVVADDGNNVVLPESSARLLARLVVSANRLVPSERLIEDIWEGTPIPEGPSTLPAQVSKLRKALANRGRVVQESGGYRLILHPSECDVYEFRAAVARGRREVQHGDPARGAETLSRGLELWRGEVLSAWSDLYWTREFAARLEEERLLATEEMIEAFLAAGHHATMNAELAALTESHPYRERLWTARILALYRTGRQVEALRAYQMVRARLVEDLGIEPNPALRELEAAILRQDPALEYEPGAGVRQGIVRNEFPLPARVLGAPLSGVVGRAVERELVARDVKAASEVGLPNVVLISGEAGVGKTTLLFDTSRSAQRDGAMVLYGRCDEDLAIPYRPWIEALSHLAAHAEGELATSLSIYGGSLAQMAPALADALGLPSVAVTADAEGARYMLFDAVTATIRAAGELAPVVLGLDDLQWADTASLQLLRHVAGNAEPCRLLVIGAFRDSNTKASRPLGDVLIALNQEPSTKRVALRGLDSTELLALLESVTGQQQGEEGIALRDALLDETNGNPLFVGEILRHLAETGALHEHEGRWTVPNDLRSHGIPVELREIIGRRANRLGNEAARLLTLASVIGREFDLELISSASGVDSDSVLDILDSAVDASLVENLEGTRYTFVHALIEHALYDSILPARKTRLHRLVAETIEATDGADTTERAVELAHHFSRAEGSHALAKAIHYGAAAADAALANLAPHLARRYYAETLVQVERSTVADEPLRCRLLIGLGDSQRQSGDSAFRQTLLDAAHLAQELESTDLLVAAALANDRGWINTIGIADPDRLAVLNAACHALQGVESAENARLLALLATEMHFSGEPSRQRSLADEAMTIARTCDPAIVAFVATRACLAVTSPGTLSERRVLTAEAVEAANRAGDPVLQFWCTIVRSAVLCESAEVDEARELLAISRALARRLDQPLIHWSQTFREAMLKMLTGDLAEAERLAVQARKLGGAIGEADAAVIYSTQIGPIRFMQGRGDEIADVTSTLAKLNPSMPGFSTFAAHVLFELDRNDDARDLLESFLADDFAYVLSERRGGSLVSLAYASSVIAGIGLVDAAGTLFELLRPFANSIPVAAATTTGCQTNHYLGLLAASTGRDAEAERYFSEAVATHERIGAAWGLAATQLAWGRHLLSRARHEDVARATTLLEEALDSAIDRGYGRIEHRARQALESLPDL